MSDDQAASLELSGRCRLRQALDKFVRRFRERLDCRSIPFALVQQKITECGEVWLGSLVIELQTKGDMLLAQYQVRTQNLDRASNVRLHLFDEIIRHLSFADREIERLLKVLNQKLNDRSVARERLAHKYLRRALLSDSRGILSRFIR